jgi:secreted trypsin-like serine protease
MLVMSVLNETHQTLCGGTLISDLFVLTAAHCTTGFPEDKIQVYGGVHRLDANTGTANGVQVRRVVQNVVHPKYKISSNAVENDIALLQVQPAFDISPGVKKIPLATAKTPLISPGLISGWGCTSHDKHSCATNNAQFRILNKADVPFLTDDDCRKSYASLTAKVKIFDEQVCVGGGDKGACFGDSGGPLVVRENGGKVLVGVASFVSDLGCGCDGIPTVYTEVHYFVNWIQESMKNPKGGAGIFYASRSVIWLCCFVKYLTRLVQN